MREPRNKVGERERERDCKMEVVVIDVRIEQGRKLRKGRKKDQVIKEGSVGR